MGLQAAGIVMNQNVKEKKLLAPRIFRKRKVIVSARKRNAKTGIDSLTVDLMTKLTSTDGAIERTR